MDELIGAFTADRVERLTGVSRSRLTTWQRQGLITPRYVDESGWLGFKRLYSFRDLVALRTLAILRDRFHVPVRELRKATAYLKEHYEEPWTKLTFYVLGKEVLFEDPATGHKISAARRGQHALDLIELPIERVMASVSEQIERDDARKPDEIGQIALIDRAWRIAGTRIPTDAVWSYHVRGANTEQIIDQYPDLTPEDVTAAIRHEQQRRAA
jgi:DNA-binding transcriptional MerR regulator